MKIRRTSTGVYTFGMGVSALLAELATTLREEALAALVRTNRVLSENKDVLTPKALRVKG